MEFKYNDWVTVINDNFIEPSNNSKICSICGSSFTKTNNRQIACLNHYFKFKCCTCGKEIVSRDKHRGEMFSYYKNKQYFCPNRGNARYTCKDRFNCENKVIFENESIKAFGYKINDLTRVELTCQQCGTNRIITSKIDYKKISSIIKGKKYICKTCTLSNNGKKTAKDNIIKYNKSEKHRKVAAKTLSNWLRSEKGSKWLLKHNQSEQMRAQAREAGLKYGKFNLKNEFIYIRDDNGYITHIITDNGKEILNDAFGFEVTGYFRIGNTVTSNVTKAWKNKNIAKPISEQEYLESLPKFQYTKDKDGNIIEINSVPIEIYIDRIKKLEVNFIPEGFKLISTFRDQDSYKRNSILDDYLVKEGISWFVYIKYDELGYPLVIGKSGSKLVNSSDCDIVFDKNPDGGPARQYLIENNLDWNKTQIAIYPCDSEDRTFEFESYIINKYKLFGS